MIATVCLANSSYSSKDGASAHAAKSTQQWLAARCPYFINKDAWPTNSPDLNLLDYHVWGWMLEK